MVGDRVLIAPDEGEKQTDSGLVLPASVAEKEQVRGGRVVTVGPGYVTPNPEFTEDEPWSSSGEAVRYLPLQAEPGDFAYFLKKEALEIRYEGIKFLIVPHAAILALVRSETASDILGALDDLDEYDNFDDTDS